MEEEIYENKAKGRGNIIKTKKRWIMRAKNKQKLQEAKNISNTTKEKCENRKR